MPSDSMADRFNLPHWLMLAVLVSWVQTPARAAADGSAAYDDTANCIAVMQPNADELARQVKAGNKAQEPLLRKELVRATALAGRTYLDGLHDAADAKARLKAAQERQAAWDDARKAQVHQACLRRADAELAAASPPERFIVDRIAQSTMQRMLRTQ
jgi:hypothetical protein